MSQCVYDTEVISSNIDILTRTAVLPTAIMRIKSAQGIKQKVRVFFDQGSQMTFIRRSLVDSLGLTPIGTTHIEVSGFIGARDPATYNVVKPQLSIGNITRHIRAIVLDGLLSKIVTPGL